MPCHVHYVCWARSYKLNHNVWFDLAHSSFGKFWSWMQIAITVMLPHAQGFYIIKSRITSQRRHSNLWESGLFRERDLVMHHLAVAHSQDYQSRLRSSLNDTGSPQAGLLAWRGDCIFDFLELFILLSLTSSLLVQSGEHILSISPWFFPPGFYLLVFSCLVFSFYCRIRPKHSTFYFLIFFFLHWHWCSSHPFGFQPTLFTLILFHFHCKTCISFSSL